MRIDTASSIGDFYPRSPCGERLEQSASYNAYMEISIHALLAESDLLRHSASCNYRNISIHALLAESDAFSTFLPIREALFLSTLSLRRATLIRHMAHLMELLFLSTLSLRRATGIIDIINNVINNFYPRSPCGERLNDAINGCNPDFISIHALLAESDDTWARGSRVTYIISIHALLAESDQAGPEP